METQTQVYQRVTVVSVKGTLVVSVTVLAFAFAVSALTPVKSCQVCALASVTELAD